MLDNIRLMIWTDLVPPLVRWQANPRETESPVDQVGRLLLDGHLGNEGSNAVILREGRIASFVGTERVGQTHWRPFDPLRRRMRIGIADRVEVHTRKC